ncbi:TIGR02996 domain-containing protein [Myxococcus sp. K15C18031901]|uniref:TIGR02996 domain-containing protein n=1 Tax=Myxococcus dinghuensis TaxID=2906761 RepID=UPI0020A706ED|nr:TIGR02996 domain-containing protein [Myxococcus dinghuensis]MCP3102216.1 TIGR02996 domain-containing protein [Myxococcus dinghuensis]
MSPTKHALSSLVEPASRGAWSVVLTGLLDAWRTAPHRELADRVVAVGRLAAGRQHTPVDWKTVGTKPDPVALSALLPALLDKGSVQGRSRVEALASWPEDPRIDRWVAQLFVEPPFTSSGARPFWTRLAPLARRIRDAEAARAMLKARDGYDPDIGHEAFFAGHVDRIRDELLAATDAPLSDEDQRALAALDQVLQEDTSGRTPARAVDADALLAQVLEKPEDDELRAVLADVLLEAGHPRGELLSLQLAARERTLTPTERKREKQLLQDSRAELLGPLDAALKPESTFSRGFLSRAVLKQGNATSIATAIAKSVGHPLWATVEHLEGRGDRDVTLHPVMKALRSLAHSDLGPVKLARHLPHLESIVCRSPEDGWAEVIQDEKAFPRLRVLDVPVFTRQLEAMLTSPLIARLEQLQVRVQGLHGPDAATEVTAFLHLLAKLKVPDVTLRLVRHSEKDWSSGFRFTRDASGRLTVQVFTTTMNDAFEALTQRDVLRGLDELAKLRPDQLIVAHQWVTPFRDAVEQRARAMGATFEEPSTGKRA